MIDNWRKNLDSRLTIRCFVLFSPNFPRENATRPRKAIVEMKENDNSERGNDIKSHLWKNRAKLVVFRFFPIVHMFAVKV